jgi:hypothetical protein
MPDFKLGRLPALIPAGLHDLTYYAAGPLPRPPAMVSVPAITDWGMDMNDTLGDCGVAGINHGFMAAAADTAEKESFPTDQQVGEYYMTYTNNQDVGVVLSAFLAYVKQKGFYGHTVSAYAPVATQDLPTFMFAGDAYDFAYTGISVSQGMMTKVQETAPPWIWDTNDVMSGPVVGGHCVPIVAYDSTYLYAVTWGSPIAISYPAWAFCADEAWAVISGELTAKGADGHGINLAALQADLSRLSS